MSSAIQQQQAARERARSRFRAARPGASEAEINMLMAEAQRGQMAEDKERLAYVESAEGRAAEEKRVQDLQLKEKFWDEEYRRKNNPTFWEDFGDSFSSGAAWIGDQLETLKEIPVVGGLISSVVTAPFKALEQTGKIVAGDVAATELIPMFGDLVDKGFDLLTGGAVSTPFGSMLEGAVGGQYKEKVWNPITGKVEFGEGYNKAGELVRNQGIDVTGAAKATATSAAGSAVLGQVQGVAGEQAKRAIEQYVPKELREEATKFATDKIGSVFKF
jgi:hypothetical protein